jgi:hypothetical protein
MSDGSSAGRKLRVTMVTTRKTVCRELDTEREREREFNILSDYERLFQMIINK